VEGPSVTITIVNTRISRAVIRCAGVKLFNISAMYLNMELFIQELGLLLSLLKNVVLIAQVPDKSGSTGPYPQLDSPPTFELDWPWIVLHFLKQSLYYFTSHLTQV
jgi:hypothetical protein